MYDYLATVVKMFMLRWRTARDEGASTIEYTLLVLLGIGVAALVTTVVVNAVKSKDNQITSGNTGIH